MLSKYSAGLELQPVLSCHINPGMRFPCISNSPPFSEGFGASQAHSTTTMITVFILKHEADGCREAGARCKGRIRTVPGRAEDSQGLWRVHQVLNHAGLGGD